MRINTKIMLLIGCGLILISIVVGTLAVGQLNRTGNMAVARIDKSSLDY
jgi:hypothetical protein